MKNINKLQDGFYYIGELKIPNIYNTRQLAQKFISSIPDDFVLFEMNIFDEEFIHLGIWKIVGSWLSPVDANYLSLSQIEDICIDKNFIYQSYNKTSL